MSRRVGKNPVCRKCGKGFASATKNYGLCKRCYEKMKAKQYIARPLTKPNYGIHQGPFFHDRYGIVKTDYGIERNV